MARRLEPTVFLAMVSPFTVAMVAGAVALVLLAGGPWYLAAIASAAVWIARIVVARAMARRIAALPHRIDPFALREPWRFFVSDAVQARARFAETLDLTPDGPLRRRLLEIGEALNAGVEQCWEAAHRGQQLTDARRSIDVGRLERERKTLPVGDARTGSIDAQLASHSRLAAREDAARLELERIDVRLGEAVARATELGTRAGALGDLDRVDSAIGNVVRDLEALRLGLDDVGGIA